MDNGAHFDGDQSGTVNGVTPPRAALTRSHRRQRGYQVWPLGTPKVVKGVSSCFA
ncbi:putative tail component of prophage domain protein [Escherichia coli p0305293.12]|nr:putative tail component of prophage domain protein [Escherichia coli p0305293.12]